MSKVTICAPLYNHADHVAECLMSIAAQDVEKDIIIVDDCSSDNSLEVVQDVLGSIDVRGAFSRVEVLTNTVNMGAHFSLNRAAHNAETPYISFVNTDDYYKPGRLADLLGLGAAFAFSHIDFAFSDDVSQTERLYWYDLKQQAIEAFGSGYPISWSFLMWQHAFTTGNILIARDLFRKIGGFTNLKYCHDWDFMLKVIRHVEPVVSDFDSYVYRLHSGNTFRKLGSVAEQETQQCMRSYRLGEVTNPYAYHPDNLPRQMFEERWFSTPLHDVSNKLSQHHKPDFRTVNARNIERLRLLRS